VSVKVKVVRAEGLSRCAAASLLRGGRSAELPPEQVQRVRCVALEAAGRRSGGGSACSSRREQRGCAPGWDGPPPGGAALAGARGSARGPPVGRPASRASGRAQRPETALPRWPVLAPSRSAQRACAGACGSGAFALRVAVSLMVGAARGGVGAPLAAAGAA